MSESRVQRISTVPVLRRNDRPLDDYGNNQPVNSEHACHNDRNNVPHYETRIHHTHRADADATLRRTVGCPDVCARVVRGWGGAGG